MRNNSRDGRTRYASQLIQCGQHKPITKLWQNLSSKTTLWKKIFYKYIDAKAF